MKKINLELSAVQHERTQSVYEGDNVQTDTFNVEINLDALAPEAVNLLNYWRIEDFDSARIDWENGKIVLKFETKHFLPKGYVPDDEED